MEEKESHLELATCIPEHISVVSAHVLPHHIIVTLLGDRQHWFGLVGTTYSSAETEDEQRLYKTNHEGCVVVSESRLGPLLSAGLGLKLLFAVSSQSAFLYSVCTGARSVPARPLFRKGLYHHLLYPYMYLIVQYLDTCITTNL